MAHLVLRMGWLRGKETFSLKRSDVTRVRPEQGPEHGLPPGVAFTELRLLPETKSSPHRVADVVMGDVLASGFGFEKWMDCLLGLAPNGSEELFSTPECPAWDYHHFRTRHLWPLLEVQRISGKVTLKHLALKWEPTPKTKY